MIKDAEPNGRHVPACFKENVPERARRGTVPLGSAAAVKRDSRNVAGSRDGAEDQTERDWRVAAGVAGLGWGGQCSGHCGRRRWRIACPHSDGASRPTLPVCPTGQETGRRRALWGALGNNPRTTP